MDDLKLSSGTSEINGSSEHSDDSYINVIKENIQENGSLMQTEESEESNLGAISNCKADNGKRTWTEEEALNYVVQKVGEYLKDRKLNPLLDIKLQIEELREKFQKKKEELEKLEKAMEGLYKNEVIFLQHIGAMEKTEAKSVGVYIDLPVLPENASLKGEAPLNHIFKNVSAQLSTSRVNKNSTHTPKKRATEPFEYIDLTDDVETSVATNSKSNINLTNTSNTAVSTSSKILPSLSPKPTKHPAPLPSPFVIGQETSDIPPKPQLKISIDKNGITLQWDMPQDAKNLNLSGFDIFGYQEKSDNPGASSMWTKIGRVSPMPLPMSCVLTQFVEGSKYHFSIRAVAIGEKVGHFSEPGSVIFLPEGKK